MKPQSFKAMIPAFFLFASSVGHTKTVIYQPSQVGSSAQITEAQADAALAAMIQPRSKDSIPDALRFYALSLQAWNPGFNPNEIFRQVNEQVQRRGLLNGLIKPAMELIDIAYASGKPEFGRMLNPMLNELAPNLAQRLNQKYNLPLMFEKQSFADVARMSEPAILKSMHSMLGTDFYQKNEKQNFDPRADFDSQVLLGKNSYLRFATEKVLADKDLNKMDENGIRKGPISASTPRHQSEGETPKQEFKNGGNVSVTTPRNHGNEDSGSPKQNLKNGGAVSASTPRTRRDGDYETPRGIFSGLDMVAMNSSSECMQHCAAEIAGGVADGMFNGKGTAGRLIEIGVYVSIRVAGCAISPQCSEPKKQDPVPAPKEDSPPSPPKSDPKSDPQPEPKPETGTPKSPRDPEPPPMDEDDGRPEPKPKSDDGKPEPKPKSDDGEAKPDPKPAPEPSTPKNHDDAPKSSGGDSGDVDVEKKQKGTILTIFDQDELKNKMGFNLEKWKKRSDLVTTPRNGN